MIEQARAFAIAAHEAVGQKRKYTNTPYWWHCEEVAGILSEHARFIPGFTAGAILSAAWLHDTVEDTQVTLETIGFVFGNEVMSLVEMVTDVSKPEDGNRATRKEIDRQHLAKASPAGKTIKLADLISNTKSVVEHDPDFAKVYLREKQLLLEVLTEGDKTLWKMAAAQINPLLALVDG